MSGASLEAFFDAVAPYLAGRTSLASLEGALGRSPSPAPRMEFYRRLMAANVRRILAKVFPVTAAVGRASWSAWSERFIAALPSAHWDPNALGEDFPTWLGKQEDAVVGVAAIADWEWRLLSAARAGGPAISSLHPSVTAALYPFDVARFVASDIHTEEALAAAVAAGTPIVLVAWRGADGRVRTLRPTADEILVLADAATDDASPRSSTAHRRLSELGLLDGGLS